MNAYQISRVMMRTSSNSELVPINIFFKRLGDLSQVLLSEILSSSKQKLAREVWCWKGDGVLVVGEVVTAG